MPIDDRTLNYLLALPNKDNLLEDDAQRLRDTISDVDVLLKTNADALVLKADLVAGKVPSAQLPSYVDDVIEVADFASLPGSGETGKIYVLLAPYTSGGITSSQFRWTGSAYSPIVASPGTTDAVTEGSTNLYFTEARAQNAIPLASAGVAGKIKVGPGLSIDGSGVLSASGAGVSNTFTELSITPGSNGQTMFTPAGGYTVGQIELFLNGVLLYGGGDDYTAADGTTFTLATGVLTTDTLLLRKWSVVAVSGMVQKSGDTMTGAFNEAPAVTVASAATTNIATAASNNVTVTGTVTITSFGIIAAGACRKLTFAGACQITHNATSMILPTGANITTEAGDTAEFESLGAGNWRCTRYQRASGKALSGGSAWLRKTSAYTALSGDKIRASTTAGAWSLTFPAAPADGDEITVMDLDGTFNTNNLTILANGKKVMTNTTSWVIDTQFFHKVFVYDATLGDWRI